MQHVGAHAERARDRLARTTGQEVLFLLALGFVVGFGWWWYQAWAILIAPPQFVSPQGVFTVMISAVYALVLPLFISMLLPNSPAGWLLQQQTWAYPGQLAVMVSTIVLGFFGLNAMYVWLQAQSPALQETGMFYPALAAAAIGAYLVPGLQFAYMTPTQQLLRIQQAHEVRKLKILHGGEIAVLESRLQWLKQKALLSAVELLPGDQQEVERTTRGLLKSIADSQRKIGRAVGVSHDVLATMGLLDDKTIDAEMDYVEAVIVRPAEQIEQAMPEPERVFADAPRAVAEPQRADRLDHIAGALPRERVARHMADTTEQERAIWTLYHDGIWYGGDVMAACSVNQDEALQLIRRLVQDGHAALAAGGGWVLTPRSPAYRSRQDAHPATPEPRPAPSASPPRPAAPRRAPPRYAAELQQARGVLSGMWTARQLGDALGKSERMARDWIAVWEEAGLVNRGETKGTFYFTESEAA